MYVHMYVRSRTDYDAVVHRSVRTYSFTMLSSDPHLNRLVEVLTYVAYIATYISACVANSRISF